MNDPSPGYQAILAELERRARFALKPHSRPAQKLEPLRRLLAKLGHPERRGRIVHIAGTNGKGTTAEMVSRLLRQTGRNVGLYTSPHLLDVRERVRLNGVPVNAELFAEVAERVLAAQARMPQGEALSFFDLMTAIGFLAFRGMDADWTVLETGLGGTADSTNVTETKDLCILTPIGHDHLTVLGGDLRSIARQKMGIARGGTPVVLFRQAGELHDWMVRELEVAGAPVSLADTIRVSELPAQAGLTQVGWPDGWSTQVEMPWYLATEPHYACAAAALTAADLLLGQSNAEGRAWRAETALRTALAGRLQLAEQVSLAAEPGIRWTRVVLDGGHNREAMAALVRALETWKLRGYTLLITLMRDKLVEPVREPLRDLLAGAERVIGVMLPYERAPGADELRTFMEPLLRRNGGLVPLEMAELDEALRLAGAWPERPLVAAGSLWMLGDLLKRLNVPRGTDQVCEPKPSSLSTSAPLGKGAI
jgi:dihydrofolate synthase/folylpolyglutamate synthase